MDVDRALQSQGETPADTTILTTASSLPTTSEESPHHIGNSSNDGESYGWRFWMIIASLSVTSLLTAIEGTVTATALPTITRTLESRELYVWFVNAIFLSR